MNRLVAVLSQNSAERARRALECEGLDPEQVSLVGPGHQTLEEFGLSDPKTQVKQWIQRLLCGLGPLGCIAGSQLIPSLAIGGVFGGIAGTLGAVFVGGAIGRTAASEDAKTYRDYLDAGQYIVIVRGLDEDVYKSARLLQQRFAPEYLQGYEVSIKRSGLTREKREIR